MDFKVTSIITFALSIHTLNDESLAAVNNEAYFPFTDIITFESFC